MKNILTTIFILFCINVFAQDADKIATLVATGQGKTTEEATGNALRSAIEQAFGAFISSKTEVLNDSLIRDEIVSVSNGNIQKYELLSTQTLPNGLVANTVKATVSILKLTTFCESKGLSVEFKGGLFAANILLQELSDKNELIAWQQTKKVIYDYIESSLDYSIEATTPRLHKDSIWKIPITITNKFNPNFQTGINVLYDFIKACSLTKQDAKDYGDLGKEVYPLVIALSEDKFGTFYFRNKLVNDEIFSIPMFLFKTAFSQIRVNNGLLEFDFEKYIKRGLGSEIEDIGNNLHNFRKNFAINVSDNFFFTSSFLGNQRTFGLAQETRGGNFEIQFVPNNKYDDRIYVCYSTGGWDLLEDFLTIKKQTSASRGSWYYPNADIEKNFAFIKTSEDTLDTELKKKFKNNTPPYFSLISINSSDYVFKFKLNDFRTLDELKQISKYEVSKK